MRPNTSRHVTSRRQIKSSHVVKSSHVRHVTSQVKSRHVIKSFKSRHVTSRHVTSSQFTSLQVNSSQFTSNQSSQSHQVKSSSHLHLYSAFNIKIVLKLLTVNKYKIFCVHYEKGQQVNAQFSVKVSSSLIQ